MPRSSKGPWLRTGRGYWVKSHGKQVFLDFDEQAAKTKWHRLMAGLPLDDDPGVTTFAEVAEAYVSEVERTRSANHFLATKWRLDQLCEFWGRRAATSLTARDVEAVIRHKMNPPPPKPLPPRKKGERKRTPRKPKPWGPTTQNGVLTSLRACLRWASRPGGLIDKNPLPYLTLPKPVSRQQAMTPAQVKDLLKVAGPELRSILWALSQCGARPGELARAKAADCDADGSAIRLPTGKQGRRLILFPKGARAKLKAIRKAADGGLLFPDPFGNRWAEAELSKQVRKARAAAKLPEWVTAYSLRHTWITERLRQRHPRIIPIAVVARMAGTSVALIDRVYGHLADQDLRAVADEMG